MESMKGFRAIFFSRQECVQNHSKQRIFGELQKIINALRPLNPPTIIRTLQLILLSTTFYARREMKKKNQKLKIMFPIIQIFRSHY